jgi:AcrR family transcriptional regulator
VSARPKTGVTPAVIAAIIDAIALLGRDRTQRRTAVNLAKLAGTSRPTLYRAFGDRPELRAAFERLTVTDQLDAQQRIEADRRIAELRADNAQLRRLVTALATVAEALKRENLALRHNSTGGAATLTPMPDRHPPRRR